MFVHRGAAGAEFKGFQKGAFGGAPIEIESELNEAGDAVYFSKLIVQLQGTGGRRLRETNRLLGRRFQAAINTHLCVSVRDACPSKGKVGVPRKRRFKVGEAATIAFRRELIKRATSPQVEVVGLEVVSGTPADAGALIVRQLGAQGIGDVQRDVSLYGENVGQIAIVSLRPNVFVAFAVDKLGDDAHPVAGPANAAFD